MTRKQIHDAAVRYVATMADLWTGPRELLAWYLVTFGARIARKARAEKKVRK